MGRHDLWPSLPSPSNPPVPAALPSPHPPQPPQYHSSTFCNVRALPHSHLQPPATARIDCRARSPPHRWRVAVRSGSPPACCARSTPAASLAPQLAVLPFDPKPQPAVMPAIYLHGIWQLDDQSSKLIHLWYTALSWGAAAVTSGGAQKPATTMARGKAHCAKPQDSGAREAWSLLCLLPRGPIARLVWAVGMPCNSYLTLLLRQRSLTARLSLLPVPLLRCIQGRSCASCLPHRPPGASPAQSPSCCVSWRPRQHPQLAQRCPCDLALHVTITYPSLPTSAPAEQLVFLPSNQSVRSEVLKLRYPPVATIDYLGCWFVPWCGVSVG